MVIRLNASDDSDSEIEASGSAQCVFGGLESMIKEARRSVEVREKTRRVTVSTCIWCTTLSNQITILTCDVPGSETETCSCGREGEQPTKDAGHFT